MKKSSMVTPMLALLLIGIAFAVLPMSPKGAVAQPVSLNQSQHGPGTRILESCAVAAKLLAEDCVMEKVVMEWSPSGRFVKLVNVGFTTPGEWRLPRQVKVVELLAVPKSEPVSKKVAEMVLNEGGRVRLQ
jgi:hypothetical protein